MIVESASRRSRGDLAPKSASTLRTSTTNESAGAPRAGTAGTRISVPRMIRAESFSTLGTLTRNMLCTDGTPPTARVVSTEAGGGVNKKLAPGARATAGLRWAGDVRLWAPLGYQMAPPSSDVCTVSSVDASWWDTLK